MSKLGVLYLVPVPIGNYDDITLRGLRILRECDVIACEEFREARRLLLHLQIMKPLIGVNEHTEQEATKEVLRELESGKRVALISDAGTPVFSDPGLFLVRAAITRGVSVVPLPGASSLLPALIASGFRSDAFVFVGWLSPKRDERRRELDKLKHEWRTLVIMDTPYRLLALLRDATDVLGRKRRAAIAFDISAPAEEIVRGRLDELRKRFEASPRKSEFVLVIEGAV